ncbi:AI-2E family transporter [Streptosporangium pseudovulgare]|uniref:AI-2E family transporter n=1 Tax=Streptosporangium pseudovulgare TaxID=35765 RepID=A0ABQ2QIW1_9ACTN|nr:AI-2E family transporter [Streptosporangium pseudovulgare]GGP83992.1 AI-2E family transporter [Streptosporangium pseudovulgare]
MISDRERLTHLVPRTLLWLAAWSLCLIIIGWAVFYFWQFILMLHIVVLPVAVALLLTALLSPLTSRFRALGMRPIYATWLTMLIALAVLAGVGWFIGLRASEEFPRVIDQLRSTIKDVENWLYTGPLHLQRNQISTWIDSLTDQLSASRNQITQTVLTGATVAVEVLASLVLVVFVTFFLLKDGARIWSWLLKAFGSVAPRVDRAGRAAWTTLSHYVHGTVAVAAVHGVVMGIVLAGMGVPLWAPLAVLIFMASFIPLIGILFAGAVAALVTLGAKGLFYALIFVGILVIEQQLENHVLQPLIVGRALDFHPLAIILVLAVGGVVAGIAGAAVAVPIAAVFYRALPALTGDQPALPPAPPHEPPEGAEEAEGPRTPPAASDPAGDTPAGSDGAAGEAGSSERTVPSGAEGAAGPVGEDPVNEESPQPRR